MKKKALVFLSITCIICLAILGFLISELTSSIKSYNILKKAFIQDDEVLPIYQQRIILYSVFSFLMLAPITINVLTIVLLILKKLPTINVKESIHEYREYRVRKKQEHKRLLLARKQEQVKLLQEELNDIEKDE